MKGTNNMSALNTPTILAIGAAGKFAGIVIDAAQQAGVKRFVFSALIHPVIGTMSHHIAKVPVEEAAIATVWSGTR
jgi:hypothetical protein